MVKVRGQSSNRNTVKQAAENGQKARCTTTRLVLHHGARRQEVGTAEWSCNQTDVTGSLKQVKYEMILVDHEPFESHT